MNMRMNHKSINRALLICLLMIFVLTCAAGCGIVGAKSEGIAESNFRKQMANASVLEITVDKDLVLEAPVEVSGNKVLVGEGSVTAVGKWAGDNYMFVVPSGSQLTVKGSVTIDAADLAGAIHVAKGAALTVEENATIKSASAKAHNVLNEGTATISGGQITGSGEKYAGVCSSGTLTQNGGVISGAYNNVVVLEGGSFTWNAGSNTDSVRDGVYIAQGTKLSVTSKNATLTGSGVRGIYLCGEGVITNITLNTSGDSLIKISKTGDLKLNGGIITDAGYHGIENAGNLVMTDGQIRNCFNCGIVNTGNLEITGGSIMDNTANKGLLNKHDGKATISSATVMFSGNRIAIGNEDTAQLELSNAQFILSSATNIYAYGGTVNIHDITLGASGSNNVRIVAADVTMNNVQVMGNAQTGSATTHGILLEGGKLDMTDVTVKNTTGYGIRNKGGLVTAKNLTISTSTKAGGINNTVQDVTGRPGIFTVNGLTVENIRYNNLVCDGGTLTVNNGQLEASGTNNVKTTGGTLYLNDVDVKGNWEDTAGTNHAVYMTGGTIIAKNVHIRDAKVTGLRINGETAVFTGSNVTISNATKYAIDQTIGLITIDGLKTEKNYYNITNNGGTIHLTNSYLGPTVSNNVRLYKGLITLNNVVVDGHTPDHVDNVHALFVSGGELTGTNVTTQNTSNAGLRVNAGTATLENLTVKTAGADGVWSSAGITNLTNVTIEAAGSAGIAATGDAVVNVTGGTIGNTVSHGMKSENDAKVTMTNVTVTAPTTSGRHAVLAQGGDIHLEKVTLVGIEENTEGAGIRINRETSHVTGNGISITGFNVGISSDAGTSDIYGVTTLDIADHSVYATNQANLVISDSLFGISGTNNAKAEKGGTLTLNNVTIDGTKTNHGVMVENDGHIYGKNLTVMNTDSCAVRVKTGKTGSYITIDGLTTSNIGGQNAWISVGDDLDVDKSYGGITIVNGDLCKTKKHSITVDCGELTMVDTQMHGHYDGTANNIHTLYILGGKVDLNGVTVLDTAGDALRVSGGKVMATNFTSLHSGRHGAFADGGELVISDSYFTNTKEWGLYNKGTTTYLNNVTFGEIGGDSVIYNIGSGADKPGKVVVGDITVEDADSALAAVHNNDVNATVEVTGLITMPNSGTGIFVEQGSATVNGGRITGAQYAVRNAATFTMNGGWLYNNIWGLYNEATGEATLNGGFYFGNMSGSSPSDLYNAGKLTISDITVGYTPAGTGTSGVIYQAAGAQPIILKGDTLGLHTASKPVTLVTDPWQQMWGVKQTVVLCDSIEAAKNVEHCFAPGKGDPVLYISRRNDTLELTTLPGGNYIVSIGSEMFESFADAFDYMAAKGMTEATLQVVDSFEMFEAVQIPAGYKVTLTDDGKDHHVIKPGNLNGHMFTVGQNAQLILSSTNDSVSSLRLDVAKKADKAAIFVNGGKAEVISDFTIANGVYGVYIADGEFVVADNAALTISGGTTGIYAEGGKAVISTLNTSGLNYNINVNGESADVTVNGGTIGQSGSNSILCYKGTLTLNNATVEGTRAYADGNLNAVFARGGDINLNNVTITGADAAGIRISDAGSTVVATNVTISDCGAYSAWVSNGSLEFRGTNTLGITPNNNIVADGTGMVDIYDTLTVSGTTGASHHNIYINGGTVTNHGTLNLNDSAAAGLRVSAGSFISTDAGAKVNIARSASSGIIPSGGKIVIDGLTISESAERNIYMWANTEADVTITDAVLEKTPLDNIFIEDTTGGNKLALNSVQIQGATDGHGINVASGTVTGSDVTISGSTNGICVTAGNVTLNGANISGSTKQNLVVSGGELIINGYADGSKSSIGTAKTDNISVTGGGVLRLNDVDVAAADANNIVATGGKVYLTDSTVTGGGYSVLVQADGYAELNDVTITASRNDGIRVNQPTGVVVVNDVEIVNPNRYGISAEKGSVQLKGDLTVSSNNKKSWGLYSYNGGSITADAGTKVTITNTQYGLVSHSNSVLSLDKVVITGISNDAIYSDGNNVNAASGAGVTVNDLSVNGCGRGIYAFEKGAVTITGSASIVDNTGIGIEVNTSGTVVTNNLTINTTKTDATHAHNVKVTAGIITMNGTTVLGQSNSQNVLIDGANGNIVMNGSVTVGGTDSNNGLRVINGGTATVNGTLTLKNIKVAGVDVESSGKLIAMGENSKIVVSGCDMGVYVASKGNAQIRDLSISDVTGYGVRINDGTAEINGLTVKNVTSAGTAEAPTGYGIYVQSGTLTLEGVISVSNTARQGILVNANTTLDASNATSVTVDTTANKTDGISNYGTFLAKNLTVKNTSGTAIQNFGGTMTLTNVTTSGMQNWHSLKNSQGGIVTVDGASFGKSPSNNVYADKGTMILKGTITINGTNNNDALVVSGDTAKVELQGSLMIKDAKRYGLYVANGGTIEGIDGSSLSISSTGTGMEINSGKVTLKNVTVNSATGHAMKIQNASEVSISGLTAKSTINNIRVMHDAKLELSGEIVIDGGTNGIAMDGNTTVTIHDGITVKNVSADSIVNWSKTSTLKLAGNLELKSIYSSEPWTPEIIGTVTSSAPIELDWNTGKQPADLVALKFVDGTIAGANEIFYLGGNTFGAGYLLWFDADNNVARLSKTVTNEIMLDSVISNADQLGLKELNIVIGGSFAVTDQVDFGGVTNVTITDDGDAATGSTITYNGTNSDIFGLTSGDSLTLKGITLDCNGKGRLLIPEGATVTVSDVTVNKGLYEKLSNVDYCGVSVRGTLLIDGNLTIDNAQGSNKWVIDLQGAAKLLPAQGAEAHLTVKNAAIGLIVWGDSQVDLTSFTSTGLSSNHIYVDGDNTKICDVNIGNVNITGGSNSVIVKAGSSVTIGNATITGSTASAVKVEGGSATFSNLDTVNCSRSVHVSGGTITVQKGVFGKTTTNSIQMDNGTAFIENVQILGTGSYHGVAAQGGDVTLTNVSITGYASAGIRVNNAASVVTVNNVTVEGSGHGVSMSAGEINGSGLKINTNSTAIDATDAVITLTDLEATSNGHSMKLMKTTVAKITNLKASSAVNNVRVQDTATLDLYGNVLIENGDNGIAMSHSAIVRIHDGITIRGVKTHSINRWTYAANTVLELSGELNIDSIYADNANLIPTVVGNITSASGFKVDWAAGKAPTGTAIKFASKQVQEASSKYITLGSVQTGAGKALKFADDTAVLVNANVISTWADLSAAISALNSGDTAYYVISGNAEDWVVSSPLTIPSGATVYLSGTDTTPAIVGEAGVSIFALTKNSVLNLDNLTLGGTENAYSGSLVVVQYSTLNLKNTTVQYSKGDRGGAVHVQVYGTLNATGSVFTKNTCANYGGAIGIWGGTANLTGCVFDGNTATNAGGAIMNYKDDGANGDGTTTNIGGKLLVDNCVFVNNESTGASGGAIAAWHTGIDNGRGSCVIVNTEFTNNHAKKGTGGAIDAQYAMTVDGCTFTGNSATGNGGAIRYGSAEPVTIKNSEFYNNTTTVGASDTAGGGALMFQSGPKSIVIENCLFEGNQATNSVGGAILLNSGTKMTVTGCTFTNNYSATKGGAINARISTEITDCTFTGNSSGISGGAVESLATMTVTNVEFTENVTKGNGGALRHSSSGALTVTDCVFTGNKATFEVQVDNFLDNNGGGALIIQGGPNATITGCAFRENYSGHMGGAMKHNSGTLTMSDSEFSGNEAVIGGGALAEQSGNSNTVTNCTMTENTAAQGGAIYLSGKLTVQGGTFSKNTAAKDADVSNSGMGGAVYSTGTLVVQDSAVFTDNTAEFTGGAINVENGSANISGSTFTGNAATGGDAGAIRISKNTTVKDCTFDSNTATGNGGALCIFSTVSVDGCSFTNGSAAQGGGISLATGHTLNLSDSTFSGNTATGKGYEASFDVRVADATQSGGIHLSGKIVGTVWNNQGHKVNISGALTEGSALVVDWRNGKYAADMLCVSYADAAVMAASGKYLTLSEAMLAAGYQLSDGAAGSNTQILTKAAAAAQVSEEMN